MLGPPRAVKRVTEPVYSSSLPSPDSSTSLSRPFMRSTRATIPKRLWMRARAWIPSDHVRPSTGNRLRCQPEPRSKPTPSGGERLRDEDGIEDVEVGHSEVESSTGFLSAGNVTAQR